MPSPSQQQDYSCYLDLDPEAYRDEWAAIVHGAVIAHGKDLKSVLDQAKRTSPNQQPLLAKLPPQKALIL